MAIPHESLTVHDVRAPGASRVSRRSVSTPASRRGARLRQGRSRQFPGCSDHREQVPVQAVAAVFTRQRAVGCGQGSRARRQWARALACASTAGKLTVCRDRGADDVIDYATEDVRERIKAVTGGRGVDAIVDPVGGGITEVALRSMAWRGRLLVIGFAEGNIPKI